MRLKGQHDVLPEEVGINVYYGLEDHCYARHLIRRVGPRSAAAARFSERGWAYGDPSYLYGTDPIEVFSHQAGVVAYTLFAERLSLELMHFCPDEEELYGLLAGLCDEEDLPAFPEAEPEEMHELAEAGVYEDGATLIAEFSGEPELVWRLKGALASKEVPLALPPLHYAPGYRRGPAGSDAHFVLVFDVEMYPEREVVHHELFDALIRAREVIEGA